MVGFGEGNGVEVDDREAEGEHSGDEVGRTSEEVWEDSKDGVAEIGKLGNSVRILRENYNLGGD